ncbi:MAG TPA: iron-containing redox enzyme family protein [Candidatus Binatia bacterium]
MGRFDEIKEELNHMVNRQFESPEFNHFLNIKWTLPRARFYLIHNSLYVKNRRDCWGYVLGASPLDVKAIVWEHEKEELINDPRCGTDHFTLCIRQGESIGLKKEDIVGAEPIPAARATFYAWIHLAKDRPWIEALASSSILERRNNGQIVKGGGLSGRIGKQWREDLGLEWSQMPAQDVHRSADEAHSDMMEDIFTRHVNSDDAGAAVLHAAGESLAIDRAFRGALADEMERL